MTFMQRSVKHFLVTKAVKEIKQEIEKVKLDDGTSGVAALKILADAGISIIGTYLNGCAPAEKATYRRDLNALLQMGVTIDMLLDEVSRQLPEVLPLMKGKDKYREMELQKIREFLKT